MTIAKTMIESRTLDWTEAMPRCLFIPHATDDEWKKTRCRYICASDTANILGCGFRDNVSVWQDKMGVGKFDPSPAVAELMEKGRNAEEHIRELFAIDRSIDRMYDGTRVMIVNKDIKDKNGNPFMACTLDAWAKDSIGNLIVEIKRSESPKQFGDEMPMKYRAQVLKQMIVTGIERAVLVAHISYIKPEGTRSCYTKEYWIGANDIGVKNDMDGIVKEETDFWNRYVIERRKPPRIMPNI